LFDSLDRRRTVLFSIYANSQFNVNAEEVTHKFYSIRYHNDVSGDRPDSFVVWISYGHCQISGPRMRCWRPQGS